MSLNVPNKSNDPNDETLGQQSLLTKDEKQTIPNESQLQI